VESQEFGPGVQTSGFTVTSIRECHLLAILSGKTSVGIVLPSFKLGGSFFLWFCRVLYLFWLSAHFFFLLLFLLLFCHFISPLWQVDDLEMLTVCGF
jgi:hypothetical protein